MNIDNSRFGLKSLKVIYADSCVGTLAITTHGQVAFSYDESWLKNGFSISPFSLPLESKVFIPSRDYFGGLFGIFADSLPDAWGHLLVDRLLREYGIDNINVLDRLALVGHSGMGALEYEPDFTVPNATKIDDLDYLSEQCKAILNSEYSKDLDSIYQMGGSSGGARPKILTTLDDKEWIIKFPMHNDSADCGLIEYNYSQLARRCKIDMPETRLFHSEICRGYYGAVRFDRIGYGLKAKKIHMATVASLLEADFRAPCLDYNDLMKLTRILTNDNKADIENMFRRVCFNVFAHNCDDHAKNFTFLYNDINDCWRLSPAYDLTYSNTFYGEHTTSVDGNGANPGEKELLSVGLKAQLKKNVCLQIIDEIRDITAELNLSAVSPLL